MLESTKVPALTRAIEILNLIGRIGPCSAATIIAELGIPKSTVYLLLGELKKQRFISMDNQDKLLPVDQAGGAGRAGAEQNGPARAGAAAPHPADG